MMLPKKRFFSAKAVFLRAITVVSILLPLAQTAALAYLESDRQELL